MSILRKIVSFVVLVAAIVLLVGVCMSSLMNPTWAAFKAAFSPFDFQKLIDAISLFFTFTGNAIILLMLGFIGLTMPGKRK